LRERSQKASKQTQRLTKRGTLKRTLNWQNFRDFGLTNQATIQRENMNLNYAS